MSHSLRQRCPRGGDPERPHPGDNWLELKRDNEFRIPGKELHAGQLVCQECGHDWWP